MTNLSFATPPSLWSLYPRVVMQRKPSLLGEGEKPPILEATLTSVAIEPAHLSAYRAVCGWAQRPGIPITYPHVLAGSLHLAMLSSPAFPVRVLGLVHLAQRIEQRQPLQLDSRGSLVASLVGMTETERGQEFELITEFRQGSEVPWRGTSIFLARKKRASRPSAPREPQAPAKEVVTFDAPSGLGRTYGRIAGDLNPIHVADFLARLFGFPSAIAHGMWSLARCAAELNVSGACELSAQFKLPILLPAKLRLEKSSSSFVLVSDDEAQKPHVVGTVGCASHEF
jgi:hypothetical protein